MKIILLLFLLPFYSNAQKVEQYCNAIIGRKAFTRKIVMQVDYGEYHKLPTKTLVQDSATGKELLFNSTVDALNFLGRSGWKLVDVTSVPVGDNAHKHYLFKKEVDILELETTSSDKKN
ncbi:MAG TPA: hypothetical protein VM888_03445 [Chitinophagaceae bacterium]|jgi:hypothetical protein|nr:hypothetical protein [Chitinophagaceae bacterium]